MLISIVIPLYNKELSIAGTLQSVLAQSYTDFEVVVVNDGSTDNSAEIVRQLMLKEKCIRMIEQPNAGVSAARNVGILAAKGEFIAFLDADDLWAPYYLEALVALIRDYPNFGLYSLGYYTIDTSTLPNDRWFEERNKKTTRGSVSNPWIGGLDLYIGSTCASRKKLMRVGLLDTRMTHGEDLDICWRLILDSGLVCDNKCYVFYRVDAENRAMHRVPPLEKHIPFYVDKYATARAANLDFRRFYDEQMIYRLYPYLFDKRYKTDAKRIAKQFDYSLQKKSMWWRMHYPRLYRIYQKLKNIK